VDAESLGTRLGGQLAAWRRRPLLRSLYREWFLLVRSRLSAVPGPTVELGSGIGALAEVIADVVTTDVEPTPWASRVVDAERLPFETASVSNIVLVDVFHHLARPSSFLDEAARTLRPGGRVVMVEPYCSPLSTFAYRHFHHEDVDLDVTGLDDAPELADSPLAGNSALPTLVFFRCSTSFAARWPELRVVERQRFALFLYPLSGGFSRSQLVPAALFRPLAAAERALQRPLGRLAAFRCLVVLERTGSAGLDEPERHQP
jgi:SAM-dependent methyltransferase